MFTTKKSKYFSSFEKYIQCMKEYNNSDLDMGYKTAKRICIIHATKNQQSQKIKSVSESLFDLTSNK